jgi:hypothetical protein
VTSRRACKDGPQYPDRKARRISTWRMREAVVAAGSHTASRACQESSHPELSFKTGEPILTDVPTEGQASKVDTSQHLQVGKDLKPQQWPMSPWPTACYR